MQEIKDRAASIAGLALERDAIFLYDALAKIEKDPARRGAFERIAASERRHAAIWEAKLLSLGEQVPAAKRPSWRVRQITLLARLFGTRAVSDMVKALEGYEEEVYGAHSDVAEVTDIAADEALRVLAEREEWICLLLDEVKKRRVVPRDLLEHERQFLDAHGKTSKP